MSSNNLITSDEKPFTYKWITEKSFLSTTFDFGTTAQFIGKLNITFNDPYEPEKCTFSVFSTTHHVWKVNVRLWHGITKPNKAPVALHQDNNSTSINLPYNDYTRENYTIMCEVIFVDFMKESIALSNESKLSADLLKLLKSEKYWDVTLVVAGHELHVHKAILASRSAVFAAMFEHEMEEVKSNKVTITDIEFEVFEEMLRYIYTGEVVNLNKLAPELLAAGDKYDLPKLISMCQKELIKNISIENAADILVLADLHKAIKLKKFTIGFISNNSKAVSDTEVFKQMAKDYSHLILELYLKIAK